MTPEFKTAILQRLRETPDEQFKPWHDLEYLKLLLPWVHDQFPGIDLSPTKEQTNVTVNWNVYMELTGLKRLDFFLPVPPINEQTESGQVIKRVFPPWTAGYPCATVGSIIYHRRPTFGQLADMIENHYIEASSFAECLELMDAA